MTPLRTPTTSGLTALVLRQPAQSPYSAPALTTGAPPGAPPTGQSPFWSNFAPNAVFGFFDNYLMILFGEAIEKFIRKRYPGAKKMSPLKLGLIAAGLGNTLSDAFGVSAAEALMGNVLEQAYPAMRPSSDLGEKVVGVRSSTWGKIAGIVSGCLVGLYGGVNAKVLTGAAFGGFTLYSMARGRQNAT